jgi:hypothetical protein
MLDNAVKQMIMSKSESKDNEGELEKYKARVDVYKFWKEKHKLCTPGKVIKVGDKVDVRDTEYIWCAG